MVTNPMSCTQCVMLQDKLTALMAAAAGGHTDVVQVLLSRQDVGTNMTDKVCYYIHRSISHQWSMGIINIILF